MAEKNILKSNDLEQFQVKKTNKVLRALIYIGLVIWALIDLFPIYWMFTFSLKSNEEVYGANVMGLPRDWIWDNYTTAMTTGNMPLYFMNSVIVTLAANIAYTGIAVWGLTRMFNSEKIMFSK